MLINRDRVASSLYSLWISRVIGVVCTAPTNLGVWSGACPIGRCVWLATGRSHGCTRGCGPIELWASAPASRTRRGPEWWPRSAETGSGWKCQPKACAWARRRCTAAHLPQLLVRTGQQTRRLSGLRHRPNNGSEKRGMALYNTHESEMNGSSFSLEFIHELSS